MNKITNSTDYATFLNDIKEDVKKSRLTGHPSINKEMVHLFYRIGRGLIEKQSEKNWNTEDIKQLATDLKHYFPEMKGFSLDELKTMRILAWYFSEEELFTQKIDHMPWDRLKAVLNGFENKKMIILYVQKCLEENWSLDALLKGMEEEIHVKK